MDRQHLNILIVEDDPVIGTDIKSLLRQEGFGIAGVAFSALKAFDMLANRHPNFAILDIHLGAGDTGIEVAEVIHDQYQIPYIFLTSFSDEHTLAAAQEQGPYGYLVKPFQDKTLISTVITAWHHFERLQQPTDQITDSKLEDLTPQEQKICVLLVQGQSYKQICSRLHISLNTLKYHAKNIYTKLDIGSRSELAHLLHR